VTVQFVVREANEGTDEGGALGQPLGEQAGGLTLHHAEVVAVAEDLARVHRLVVDIIGEQVPDRVRLRRAALAGMGTGCVQLFVRERGQRIQRLVHRLLQTADQIANLGAYNSTSGRLSVET
jgi:hypothetical protein